jgi:hypothetical protein
MAQDDQLAAAADIEKTKEEKQKALAQREAETARLTQSSNQLDQNKSEAERLTARVLNLTRAIEPMQTTLSQLSEQRISFLSALQAASHALAAAVEETDSGDSSASAAASSST